MTNRALYGAYRRGYDDAKKYQALPLAERQPLTGNECPYPDKRTYRGSVTFSRSFRIAWFDGWEDATFERKMRTREEY